MGSKGKTSKKADLTRFDTNVRKMGEVLSYGLLWPFKGHCSKEHRL